jgi:hypothetical protein
MTLDLETIRDGLNRLAKADLDDGTAPNIETAMARLYGYRIHVAAGPEVADSAPHQAALLTVVNVVGRFALGGVTVSGDMEVPLLVLGNRSGSLAAEVAALGGRPASANDGVPTVVVGSPPIDHRRAVAVTFEGWRGGIIPFGSPRLSERTSFATSAVLGAALAANEAFAMLRGEAEAGRRAVGLSLWRPDRAADWWLPESDGPPLQALPNDLWILGLGHIGQAFLWHLLLCPFSDRSGVRLLLQDVDVISPSTPSTSILTRTGMLGRPKTRAISEVLESHGFRTSIVERPFDRGFRRRADDPAILVCGVDNVPTRAEIEAPGFPFVVEAGLGDSPQDFRSIRVHTFPASRKAVDLWIPGLRESVPDLDRPAYRRLAASGGDVCGLTRLAQTAVGAPFVGTVAGALMLAQVLRLLAGDSPDALVDLDLRAMRSRRAISNTAQQPFNPGFQPPENI